MVGGHAFLVFMSFAIYIKIFIYLNVNKDDIRPNEYPIYQSFNGSCYGNYLENYSSDLDFYTITTTNFIIRRSKARLIGGHIPYYANTVSSFRLLIICGDVELNPGPNSQDNEVKTRWRYPCGECLKPVKSNQNGIRCALCSSWFHVKCIGIYICR